MRAVVVTVAGASLLLSGVPGGEAKHLAEPPTIDPWHKVGRAGLGSLRSAIEYRYGGAKPSGAYEYRVPRGKLIVRFAGSRVWGVHTDSSHYRAPDSTGVGSQIPLGPCYRTKMSRCERRWNGFRYRATPYHRAWERIGCYGGIPTTSALAVDRGRVTSVDLSYGTPGGVGCGTRKQRPLSSSERAAVRRGVNTGFASARVRIERITGFTMPRSTRSYVGIGLFARDTVTRQKMQPLFVILRKRDVWRVVDAGTDSVGCLKVPIKVLAEMGLNCY